MEDILNEFRKKFNFSKGNYHEKLEYMFQPHDWDNDRHKVRDYLNKED
jgi:hypothetical protein